MENSDIISGLIIAEYVLSAVSISANLYTVCWMIYIKAKSLSSRCILHLHLTQIVLMLFSLPNIYKQPIGLCQFAGWIRFYSAFGNIISAAANMYILYQTLFGTTGAENYNRASISNRFKWLELAIYGIPLITLLPFSQNEYGLHQYQVNGVDYSYCQMIGHNNLIWSLMVAYAWGWLFNVASLCIMVAILIKAYFIYSDLARRILLMFGFYPIATILLWIPQTYAFYGRNYNPGLILAAPLLGFCYFIIFLSSQSAVLKYERGIGRTNSQLNHEISLNGNSSNFEFGVEISRDSFSVSNNEIRSPII